MYFEPHGPFIAERKFEFQKRLHSWGHGAMVLGESLSNVHSTGVCIDDCGYTCGIFLIHLTAQDSGWLKKGLHSNISWCMGIFLSHQVGHRAAKLDSKVLLRSAGEI